MLYQQDYIAGIELQRQKKGFSIETLTKGIISAKTYSRIISNKGDIALGVLLALVERLEIPLNEFLQLTYNNVALANIDEYEFSDLFDKKLYKQAYDLYNEKIVNKEGRTFHSGPITDLMLFIIENKLGMTDYDQFIRNINSFYDFESSFKSKLVLDTDIAFLYVFVDYATPQQKETIKNYLYPLVVEKQGQVLGHTYEIANYQCYITLLKCMRDTKTDNSIIIKTILEALIFNKRACADPYEFHLTVLVNAFNNELHLSSRIPYYLMSLLKTTSLNDYETLKSELLTTENNIQYRRYFLNIIAEGDNFYEGMLKDVTKFV